MITVKTFFRLLGRKLPLLLIYLAIFFSISILTLPSDAGKAWTSDDQVQYSARVIVGGENENSPWLEALRSYLGKRFVLVNAKDKSQAERNLDVKRALVTANVCLKSDYASRVLKGEEALTYSLNPRSQNSWMVASALRRFVARTQVYLYEQAADGHVTDLDTKVDKTALDKLLAPSISFRYTDNRGTMEEAVDQWYHIYFGYASYVILMMLMMIFALLIVPFRTMGIQTRTEISSRPNMKRQLELLGSLFVVSLVIWAIYLIGAVMVAGKPLNTSQFLIWSLNLLAMTLVGLSMGYLFSSITRNHRILTSIANILPMGLAFLSGVIIPQDLMGSGSLYLARLFPMYYYIRVVDGKPHVWLNLAIQLAFAVIYLLIGMNIQRSRRRKAVSMQSAESFA